MSFAELETVVLTRDLDDLGLRAGDLGTVVFLHDGGAVEVEFVTAAGQTRAVATLQGPDIRAVAPTDVVAVRPLDKSA